MDFFYDGQIRRYVTQFMRVFIGFKYQAGDGEQKQVPVMYGDLSRQVASIIKDNSENKMLTVPRISCYITGLELDTSRLSDATFVSKVNVRERKYTTDPQTGEREYSNVQGNSYTVERLMPTPLKLTMKADIWTSNTDQKLQLLEQILILFNPSLELQTTDNYLDWTSLTAMYLNTVNFSSRTIPVGPESDIDICSLEFEMPVYITQPAKVKKLGIVQTVITNVFADDGSIVDLENLIFNQQSGNAQLTSNRFRVLLFKSDTGNLSDHQYDLTLVNPDQAVLSLGLSQKERKVGDPVDWNSIIDKIGAYVPGSLVRFKQPSGYDVVGTFVINPIDPSVLVVSIDADTVPTNTLIQSSLNGIDARGTVDAIVDPYRFNPLEVYGNYDAIPTGIRYLMLDDVNSSDNVGGLTTFPGGAYDGPDAWKNRNGTDPVIKANTIIEWNGNSWVNLLPNWEMSTWPFTGDIVYLEGQILRHNTKIYKTLKAVGKIDNTISIEENIEFFSEISLYVQNIKTGVQYRWAETEWLKSFEGEYSPKDWRFDLGDHSEA